MISLTLKNFETLRANLGGRQINVHLVENINLIHVFKKVDIGIQIIMRGLGEVRRIFCAFGLRYLVWKTGPVIKGHSFVIDFLFLSRWSMD